MIGRLNTGHSVLIGRLSTGHFAVIGWGRSLFFKVLGFFFFFFTIMRLIIISVYLRERRIVLEKVPLTVWGICCYLYRILFPYRVYTN